MNRTHAVFGPGGNSLDFTLEGHKSTLDIPKWLTEKGLDSYEFECGRGVNASYEMMRQLGELGDEYGISMSLHAPYFISLSSVEMDKRLNSISYIEKSLEAANLIHAHTIVVHCGSCAKISRNEAMNLSKDTLYKTLEVVPYPNIAIGIETMGKLNQLGTLEEVIEICKIDRRLVPVVDFGHLNARNIGGAFKCEDDYAQVFYKIGDSLGDEVAKNLHCHFSKIMYTQQGEKMHLTFDDNEYGPEFEPLMQAISNNKLTPSIISESAGTQTRDSKMMKEYYWNLIK